MLASEAAAPPSKTVRDNWTAHIEMPRLRDARQNAVEAQIVAMLRVLDVSVLEEPLQPGCASCAMPVDIPDADAV
jgi:hypothetical protein